MEPNTALAAAVLQTLRPFLGRYRLSGVDRGLAWHVVNRSFALTNEGLPAGIEVDGLEAIFAAMPDPNYRAEDEFGTRGINGILYYGLTLKAWDASVMPAYAALIESNPLMTLSSHRQPRQIPTDLNEALAVWVPIQT